MIKYLHLDYWISKKPNSKEKSSLWCQKGLFALFRSTLYRHLCELSSAIFRKLLTTFENENDLQTEAILQIRLHFSQAIHLHIPSITSRLILFLLLRNNCLEDTISRRQIFQNTFQKTVFFTFTLSWSKLE